MKSQNHQQMGIIPAILSGILMCAGLAVYYTAPVIWKGICWALKSLYKKSPMVFRGARSATTWTATKLSKMKPVRVQTELFTPEIFRGKPVARARSFDMAQLNRMKYK